jgi:hypothetical protein
MRLGSQKHFGGRWNAEREPTLEEPIRNQPHYILLIAHSTWRQRQILLPKQFGGGGGDEMMDSASFVGRSCVSLLVYDTVPMGKQFPSFWRTVVSFLHMEELAWFEASQTTCPLMPCHVPEHIPHVHNVILNYHILTSSNRDSVLLVSENHPVAYTMSLFLIWAEVS